VVECGRRQYNFRIFEDIKIYELFRRPGTFEENSYTELQRTQENNNVVEVRLLVYHAQTGIVRKIFDILRTIETADVDRFQY